MSTRAIYYQPNYSVVDYKQWSGEWELWNGVAVSMSPSPTPLHQYVATSLASELRAQLQKNSDCSCFVLTESDWQINRNTVVRPDVSVLCNGLPEQLIDYAPSLIAEILSPSTEHKDRTAKCDLYAQQGVKHYLLVDPTERLIEVLQLCDTGYLKFEIASDVFSLTVHENCHVELQASSIFPLSRER